MRRLNSKRRIKFDTVQELRRLRLWAASLTFPAAPYEGRGYFNWKIPVHQALVSGQSARFAVQSACGQILVDAALQLAQRKPDSLSHTQVVAVIGWPDMFFSEICVFFDQEYFADFCSRDSQDEIWTPRSDQRLIDELDLAVPSGMSVRGFDTVERDDTVDPPYVRTNQTWLIGELALIPAISPS